MSRKLLKSVIFFSLFSFYYSSTFSQSAVYSFNGDLTELSGTGPDLTTIGAGSGSFVADPLLGGETVYEFTTYHGLTLDLTAAGIDLSQDYSIQFFFRFDDISGYTKIADFKNLTSDEGLYNYDGSTNFWPHSTGSVEFVAGEYAYFAVTRNSTTKEFKGYNNLGTEVLSFTDTNDDAVPDGNNLIHFFIDDTTTGGDETSAGAVYYIKVNDRVLEPNEIVTASSGCGTLTEYYVDADDDGYANGSPVMSYCDLGAEYKLLGELSGTEVDCNDGDPNLTFEGASCDDGDAGTSGDVVDGTCACVGLPASSVPTLSQWGLIILSFLILIFAVQGIRQSYFTLREV
ncbi:IPTL-CTERM sorting domain-containing protein [Portibacter lacus]|uniref:IPTL-CTERM protein sorting domain-containing protein n=1 Tax=Portibacter lacus TaxID=1099794 RepID=A0AA37SM04_9BACT|nr:IPTL-CTERM sorting domain-containing protein [Portibacter lacus]GLR16906.1 hypothetical protein GCM10007940_15210 [Portibacter lacus]